MVSRSSGAAYSGTAIARRARAAAGQQRLVVAGDRSGVAAVGGSDLVWAKMALEEGADGVAIAWRRRHCAAAHGRLPERRGSPRDASSAAQPTRKAGQASATRSSDQPGSALHAAGVYFAGSDGAAGGCGAARRRRATGGLATGGGAGLARRGGAARDDQQCRGGDGARARRANEGIRTRWNGSSSKHWSRC